MDRVFAPGGRLAAVLPGFEPRPEQAELAAAVAQALADREHLLAEAGTGTGKSLAYLVPALESGLRVVVATSTKALQAQLVEKDLPIAQAALGRSVDWALLKGRDNYLCRRSLDAVALLAADPEALFRDHEDAMEFGLLRSWLETTETGDRAELPFEPRPSLWAELAVGGDRCLGRRCPVRSSCFSEAARAKAAEARLVVTNHALYLADTALRLRGGAELAVLPDHDAVVFDEAHRLEDAATTWFGGRISLGGLRRLARDIERAARERGTAPPARLLDSIERLGIEVVAALEPARGRRRLLPEGVVDALDDAAALGSALSTLADRLAGSGEEGDALARRALRLADDLDACLDPASDAVAWAEPGTVAWAPIEVAGVLRESLWESDVTAVLVSATLEPDFLRTRLGLSDAREIRLESPFDFAEQALLYVPVGLPEPRAPGYDQRIAEEACALCRLSAGRALVLTSSYRALQALADRLEAELPYPVLRQGEAPRERLLERFRAEVTSVLVATQTFWQGVDVPGESLTLLVIDKLPFAAPDDPIVQARCERIAADGGDWFADYAVPSAILQLRQGFGRLIRSQSDRGVVAILDTRLRTRLYGRRFLTSLPPCRLVGDRDAVGAFLAAGHGSSS